LKKRHPQRVRKRCEEALNIIDQAIEKHKRGEPEDLNISILLKVKQEILIMGQVLDSSKFVPIYGRFIIDYPGDNGLIDYLAGVSHEYKKHV
jgi:hypothetical protein